MTNSTLERRVEAALDALARSVITDDGTIVVDGDRAAGDQGRARWGLWAAATLVVVAGSVATAMVVSTRSNDDARASSQTIDTVAEADPPPVTTAVASPSSSVPLPPLEVRRQVAVLDPSVAGAAPVLLSHFDEWINDDPTGPTRYAVRASNGRFDTVSWDSEPENEWHKTDTDMPSVGVVDGVEARRQEYVETDSVRYVFSRGERDRLTATVPARLENDLAPWLQQVATAADVESIAAPSGFEVLPPANDPFTVYYPDVLEPDITVTTIDFGQPIDAAAWIAATRPQATVTRLKGTSYIDGDDWPWIVESDTPSNGGRSLLVWQPRPDFIVELTTRDRIQDYADALTFLDDASQAGAVEYSTLTDPGIAPLPVTFTVVVQGETPIGRFYYHAYTNQDGQTCRTFASAESGGSSQCATDDERGIPADAICESGTSWDFTQRTLTWVLVDADQIDFVEIRRHPDDSEPASANIVTGDFETQPWAYIWAEFEDPEPIDGPSNVQITGGTCSTMNSEQALASETDP